MSKRCGVYKYVCNGEIIYVGKSDRSIDTRISDHSHESKFKPFLNKCEIYYAWLPNPAFTTIFETFLINKYKPCLNYAMKYDETVPFDISEPYWRLYSKASGCIYNNGDENKYMDFYSSPVEIIKSKYIKRKKELEEISKLRNDLSLNDEEGEIKQKLYDIAYGESDSTAYETEQAISSAYFHLWNTEAKENQILSLKIIKKDKEVKLLKEKVDLLNRHKEQYKKTQSEKEQAEQVAAALTERVKELEAALTTKKETAEQSTENQKNIKQDKVPHFKSFKSKIKTIFTFA